MNQVYYIDIHSHILPGVDDGALNLEESIAMLREAYKEGIRTIIATPHYEPNHAVVSADQLKQQLKIVQEEASKIDPSFKIHLGNEIYYESGCLAAVQEGKALTLAESRYVLIEFAVDTNFRRIYEGLQSFILSGYRPILAHIERYQCLYRREERIEELIKLGCYMQVNVSSISGSIFDTQAAYVRKLIGNNQVHLLATDSHNMRQRKPRMESILKKVARKITKEQVQTLVETNPLKILQNKYI